MDETLEKKLISNVMPILEKCRPSWDKPHTLAVVYWMKELIKKEGGDSKILITASYLHDVGYYNLVKDHPYKYDEMMGKPKQTHGQRGVGVARSVLQMVGGYSIMEKDEIIHLVEVHDNLDQIKTFNDLLLFEADSLGQIDTDRVPTNNLNEMDYMSFLKDFKEKRAPRFHTRSGKAYLKDVLKKIPEYETI